MGLEEGHIGVLRFQSWGRVGLEGGTIEVEWLHDPKEEKEEVVTYLKVHYPQRKVNVLFCIKMTALEIARKEFEQNDMLSQRIGAMTFFI